MISSSPEERIRAYVSGQAILVTGATGFIGRPLTEALAGFGANVHAITRKEPGKKNEDIRWWKGDLSDLGRTRSLLRKIGPRLVMHLAGHAWGSRKLSIVQSTFRDCLTTTVNILIAAAETGCPRVLLPGSLEEPEGSCPMPNSPYAVAKWASTVYGSMFRQVFELEVVNTRIFMTYGPGQDHRKVIPYLILSLLSGKTPILNSKDRIVDWIYIDDVVDGLLAAVTNDARYTEPIDLGTGIGIPVGSIAGKLGSMIQPKKPARYAIGPGRTNENVRVADAEATFRKINWKAKVPLDDGLRKTIDWYKYFRN